MTDQTYEPPGDAPRVNDENEEEDVDYGFGQALFEPDQYSRGAKQDPLPPAGPARARAAVFGAKAKRIRQRVVRVELACPPEWRSPDLSGCTGVAKLKGAKAVRYSIAPGASKALRFRLSRRASHKRLLAVRAKNADAAGGTVSRAAIRVR